MAKNPDRPGFRPLYQQVRDLLLVRISTGAWRPAEALPSEQALAAELGVSQGTVRKAIDSLVADSLIERRQGKGTYVAQHTKESAQFRFFKLTDDDGRRILPGCLSSMITRENAGPEEMAALNLDADEQIFTITRIRNAGGHTENSSIFLETISLPAALFPDLETHQPLPNTLYTFYQSVYGISIVGANEKLKAVSATKQNASALNVAESSPLLSVVRIAHDVAERAVEMRRSLYPTPDSYYAVELG